MIRACLYFLVTILALGSTTASAQMREITDGTFTSLDVSHAYIFYSVAKGKNGLPAQPIFMRMASAEEPNADETLFATRNGKTFLKNASARLYLLEVPPGEYLIYGLSLSSTAPTLATCFCLGTVSFSARPGIITDLGTFLMGNARVASDFSELATETGFGPSIDTGFYHPVTAIRRTTNEQYFISPSANIKFERADFRPEGRFFDPRTTFVNRLAPIQGILAYAEGKPVNPATNSALPDHFAQ